MGTLAYSEVRRKIRGGDILLFHRGRGWFSRLIEISGRGPVTHAGMAAWWGDDLMCIHTVTIRGGVVDHLSELVAKHPGRIEVHTICEAQRRKYKRTVAVETMKRIIGKPYGKRMILMTAMLHLPIVRWFVRPMRSDDANGGLPFCSAAVSKAVRAGGVDLVLNLADRFTEPGDIDRSAALELRFTLIPDAEEVNDEPPSE